VCVWVPYMTLSSRGTEDQKPPLTWESVMYCRHGHGTAQHSTAGQLMMSVCHTAQVEGVAQHSTVAQEANMQTVRVEARHSCFKAGLQSTK
jgi:hypothetical protein